MDKITLREGLYNEPNTELYKIPLTTEDFNGMPYCCLGDSGLRVSKVGLGTWKMGYPETGDGARVDEKESFKIFDRAIELGVTFWDTANVYTAASGNSERIIGKWFEQNHHQRRSIVLATKIFVCMDGLTPNHCRLSRLNIMEAVYACLERLKTDYIDLLYFHFFDPFTPPEESLMAVEDLIRQDLVRYFAVSNFTCDQLSIFRAITEYNLKRCKILAVQNNFDILKGESEKFGGKGVLEYAAANNISFIAWSPMARGLLTEKYLDLEKVGPGDRLYDEKTLGDDIDDNVKEKLNKLAELAHKWKMELNQLTLAYILTLPGMGPVIPSSSNVKQLESNAVAGKINLTGEQILQIEEIVDLDTIKNLRKK
jgi:aryl-alcohol dehydrogenase-like predicted oxidoreductase